MTFYDLYERILKEGRGKVQADITARPKALKKLWADLGPWILSEVERVGFHRFGAVGGHTAADAHTGRAAAVSNLRPANSGTSWRDNIHWSDVMVAVGVGGTKCRAEDLTRDDMTVIYRIAQQAADSHKKRAAGWRRLAAKVGDGETLGAAAGRLSANDRRFLADELGVGVEALERAVAA